MPGESFFERLFKEGFFAVLIEGLKWIVIVGSPIVVAVVTAASGYMQGLPIAYVIAAAAVAFAMTAIALLRFEDWRTRRTPAHKIIFAGVQAAFDYDRDPTTGQVISISRGQSLMMLQNIASFPISYVVTDIDSSIDGKINVNAKNVMSGIIPAQSLQLYRADRIDLHNMQPKETLECRTKFRVRYGRPGKEIFPLYKNVSLLCVFNKSTGLYSDQIPSDVPE